jgi:hypothetical protein
VSESRDVRALAPLSVATDLTVTVDGTPVGVESTGERLLLDVRTLPDALGVLRRQSPASTTRVGALLSAADLTVEVRVRGRIVAVAGADARPGALSEFLGVAPIEIRIGGLAGAVGREASAAVRVLARLTP